MALISAKQLLDKPTKICIIVLTRGISMCSLTALQIIIVLSLAVIGLTMAVIVLMKALVEGKK